ncbi:SRPBCC family protein [Micromonospora sp. NPDC005806]|uniref:SRPBCC family protein n=1 Tax=Micromonospora sp. NPDC005806 TaxID=3364234 RepID=UPI0036BE3B42
MKITNEFAVNTPVEQAWAVLTDLEGIAPCLPGAQLTGVDGDVYQGKVKVKVGPVISEFAGTARFVEKDDAQYRGVIDAKGRDARSAGNAAALVSAQLRPDGDRTLVSVDTDLRISGRLAQFGSGMIKEVSSKLLAQFVANLEAKLASEETSRAVPGGEPADTPAAPAARPEPEPATVVAAAPVATTPSITAVEPTPVETPTTAAPAEAEALDLLSIAGSSITKRLVPVLVGLVVVGAVIAWLVGRG